jgi:hypothetical protein
MRLRATLALTAGLSALLTPLAAPANALTTTSSTIVYNADPDNDGYWELYGMPADGSAAGTLLFSTTDDLGFPALSFDGTRLAYVDDVGDDGTYALYTRAADGSGSPTLISNADTSAPAWSRDGSTLAFTKFDATTGRPDVYTVPADGSASPTLVATNADEAAWSPSGRQLVVDHLGTYGDYAGLDLVTLGSNTRARVAGSATGYDGTFTPDGKWIVFTLDDYANCVGAIARVPAGGSASAAPEKVLAAASTAFFGAEVSRDGSQVFATKMSSPCGATSPTDLVAASWSDAALSSPLTPAAVRATNGLDEGALTVAGGTAAADTTAPSTAPAIASTTVAATSAGISWTLDGELPEYTVLTKPHGDPAPTSATDGTVRYHGSGHSATITGLTTGVDLDVYVLGSDASGNAAPVSAAKAFRPTAVPVLATIPRVGVATTGATFPVTFTGSAAPYDVLVGEKTKSSSYAGTQGHTYYVEVRGHDAYGNPTALSLVKTANVPVNDNWAGFTYSTGWTGVTSATRYGGQYKSATTASRTVSTKVDTSSFTIIGDKCAVCGQFKVYVDGVLKATIDTKASSTLTRQVLYAGGNFGSVKPHTIKIVTVGTSGRPRVDFDALALTR